MEVPSGSTWFGGTAPYASGPDLTYPELQKTGIVRKQQLAKIGINVSIQQLEVTVGLVRYVKAQYQMTSAYWSGTIDPGNFYSAQPATGSPSNATSKAVDALIAKARSSTSDAERKSLCEQIRAITWDDVPLVFVHYETINYLMSSKVNGSTINPPLELRFGQVRKSS